MIRRVALELLAGIFVLSTAAFAQTKGSVRFSSPRMQVASANAPARVSISGRTSPPIIVRLPAAPSLRKMAAPSSSQTASASDTVVNLSSVTPSVILSDGTFLDLGQFLNSNTPGLGFDFSHLAALNQNFGERAFIDPVTQQELALTERLLRDTQASSTVFPFFGGGSEPVVLEQQPSQAPQVIVLQQPAQQSQPAENIAAAPAPSATSEQEPLPDVGEFVLVLHNGKQINAVAFTHQGDSIVYVTKDGIRGSFPATDLDAPTTQQLNQRRGTPLQL